MKSGTTSLFNYLNRHPQICGSREKEPFAFVKKDFPNDIKSYCSLWDWDSKIHKIGMEASTDYTKLPIVKNVPERVAKLGKDRFKLIYIIRDPLKRIESHVRYTILTKCESCGIVEKDKDFSLDSGVTNNHIAFSSYAMQLDAWLEYFDRNDLLILTLEELQKNTNKVLNRVVEFIGVDNDYDFNNIAHVYGRTPEIKQQYDAHHIWKKLRSIKYLEKIVVKLLADKNREYLRNLFGKEVSRYSLNENEKQYALDKLMPDIKRLGEYYQVDTQTWWGIS